MGAFLIDPPSLFELRRGRPDFVLELRRGRPYFALRATKGRHLFRPAGYEGQEFLPQSRKDTKKFIHEVSRIPSTVRQAHHRQAPFGKLRTSQDKFHRLKNGHKKAYRGLEAATKEV